MSMYGSQKALNMGRRVGSRGDLTQSYARSEVLHGGGNGYDPFMDGYTYTFSKSSGGGMMGGMGGGMSGGMVSGMSGGMVSGTSGGMMSGMSGGMMSGMRYEFIVWFILQVGYVICALRAATCCLSL